MPVRQKCKTSLQNESIPSNCNHNLYRDSYRTIMICYTCLLVILLITNVSSFQLLANSNNLNFKKFTHFKPLSKLSFDPKLIVLSSILLPFQANADDGSANTVLIPIAISIFTMVPFLYYQQ